MLPNNDFKSGVLEADPLYFSLPQDYVGWAMAPSEVSSGFKAPQYIRVADSYVEVIGESIYLTQQSVYAFILTYGMLEIEGRIVNLEGFLGYTAKTCLYQSFNGWENNLFGVRTWVWDENYGQADLRGFAKITWQMRTLEGTVLLERTWTDEVGTPSTMIIEDDWKLFFTLHPSDLLNLNGTFLHEMQAVTLGGDAYTLFHGEVCLTPTRI